MPAPTVPAPTVLEPKTLLKIILRLGGATMLFAFPMALLPTEWMASSHVALGLGGYPQPRTPLVEYLTRSISLLYGFHGGLLLVVSRDLQRFRPIIYYLGVMNLLFGIAVLVVDLAAGLPMWWTLGEGPMVMATGLVLLFLVRRVDA